MNIPNELFIGKEFKGRDTGRFIVVDCIPYKNRLPKHAIWRGKEALVTDSLTASTPSRSYLIIEILEAILEDRIRNADVEIPNVNDYLDFKNWGFENVPGEDDIEWRYMGIVEALLNFAPQPVLLDEEI